MHERDQPKRVGVRQSVRNPDGTERMKDGPVLESVDTGDEPGVVGRMVSVSGSPRQEVTHYAAAATRPRSYPAELPFLRGIAVWVTQFPDGDGRAGARWFCAETEVARVRRDLTAHSEAVGWEPGDPPADWPDLPAGPFVRDVVFMRRGAELRMLISGEAERQWVVQLLDGG